MTFSKLRCSFGKTRHSGCRAAREARSVLHADSISTHSFKPSCATYCESLMLAPYGPVSPLDVRTYKVCAYGDGLVKLAHLTGEE